MIGAMEHPLRVDFSQKLALISSQGTVHWTPTGIRPSSSLEIGGSGRVPDSLVAVRAYRGLRYSSFCRWKQTGRIENKRHLEGDMNESCQRRIENSDGGETDAYQIDRNRADEILPNDPARPTRDCQCFGELYQVVTEQNHVRAFARNVSSRAHRDPNACLG